MLLSFVCVFRFESDLLNCRSLFPRLFPIIIFSQNYDIFPVNDILTDMTLGARRVGPVSRGRPPLHGTRSSPYPSGGPRSSASNLYLALRIFEMVDGRLLSLFQQTHGQQAMIFWTAGNRLRSASFRKSEIATRLKMHVT